MFAFERTRHGQVERWSILLDAGETKPPAHPRFGDAVRTSLRPSYAYEVGIVVLIHDEATTEFILSVHDGASEDERNQIVAGVERLAGREVHQYGDEWARRFVLHDSLRESEYAGAPSAPEPTSKRGSRKKTRATGR